MYNNKVCSSKDNCTCMGQLFKAKITKKQVQICLNEMSELSSIYAKRYIKPFIAFMNNHSSSKLIKTLYLLHFYTLI